MIMLVSGVRSHLLPSLAKLLLVVLCGTEQKLEGNDKLVFIRTVRRYH